MNLLMPFVPYLRILVCIFLGLTLPSVGMAQTVFEGQVVDKETEATLPGVTVKLLRQNLGTSTNSRGYYRLASADTTATDTLQFTSVGYKTLKLALSAYRPNMFILMELSNTQLRDVTITDKKDKIPPLHKFSMADVKTNKNSTTLPFFAQYMFAMLAKAPKKDCRVTGIKLGRRGFSVPNQPCGYAQFLVHIMSVDVSTGKPGQKIYTKQVIVNDNSLMVDVDVSADNWLLDTDEFYIAVEWQRTPINERVILSTEEIVRKTTYKGVQRLMDAPTFTMLYQPTLIAFIDSRKYTAYYMNEPGRWERYNLTITEQVMGVDVKYESHIALSATITY